MITDMLADPAYTASYTVTRTAAGTTTKGRYTPGSTSTPSIVASVQPLTGRELQILPTLEHGEERRKLYTTTELYARVPGYEADTVSIGGEDWKVIKVEKHTGFGATYYKAIVSRKVSTV